MEHQLIYTSAPKGLQSGKSGLCVVASSHGMASNLGKKLESLSGYRHSFEPGDRRNPVLRSHRIIEVGGRRYHVLSRISDVGFDNVKRPNILAHHLATDAHEMPKGGPAWLLADERQIMATAWNQEPQILPPLILPEGDEPNTVCTKWEAITGDPGWGGVPLHVMYEKRERQLVMLFSPEMDIHALVQESLRMLPSKNRWDITFATFFSTPNVLEDCNWRCFLACTDAAELAVRDPQNFVIDLTAKFDRPPENSFTHAAREGSYAETEHLI